MLYIDIAPSDIRDLRTALGLSREQFASLLQLDGLNGPEVIRRFEEGEESILSSVKIGKGTAPGNVTIPARLSLPSSLFEAAEFADLFNYQLRDAQQRVYQIIVRRNLDQSPRVLAGVFRSVARSFELYKLESGALAHRHRERFLHPTEDFVRDIISEVKRAVQGK